MAPRFVQSVLQDMLSNLSKEDYSKFWRALLDRLENVRRVRVEGIDYIDMAMFLISFFFGTSGFGGSCADIECNWLQRDSGCASFTGGEMEKTGIREVM